MACTTYNLDCSFAQEYLDDSFKYEKGHIYREEYHHGCQNSDYECCIKPNPEVKSISAVGKWGHEFGYWCLIDNDEEPACWSMKEGYPCCEKEKTKFSYYNGKPYGVENGEWCGITELQINYYNSQNENAPPVRTTTTTTTTTKKSTTTTTTTTTKKSTTTITTTTTKKPTTTPEKIVPTREGECWSLEEGYPCCEKATTEIKYTSKNGKQYGVEHGDWCGITELQLDYLTCWSSQYGYPCCEKEKTKIRYTSETGEQFGVEHSEWCGITDLQLDYIAANKIVGPIRKAILVVKKKVPLLKLVMMMVDHGV